MIKEHTVRTLRKTVVILLAIAVAGGAGVLLVAPANAQTLQNYNAEAAIDFAKTTTTNYKDCIKFARACAEKGDVPRQNAVNSYNGLQYMNYLVHFGYAVRNQLSLCDDDYVRVDGRNKIYNLRYEDNLGKIAPGDLLVYKCKKCGKYFHMAIVTGTLPDDDQSHAWMLEAQSANGKQIQNQPFYLYQHSSHGKSNVAVYALHFTSAGNGFEACTEAIGSLTAKKLSSKQVKLKWNKNSDAVAYNIYVRGYKNGPLVYMKQVTSSCVKVAIPKNSKGKYYNYKNVCYTVAPVVRQTVNFEGLEKTYKVIGARQILVKVK